MNIEIAIKKNYHFQADERWCTVFQDGNYVGRVSARDGARDGANTDKLPQEVIEAARAFLLGVDPPKNEE
jgi:hypothetical protein